MTAQINTAASFAAQTFALENWVGHVWSMKVRSLGDSNEAVIVTAECSFGIETIIANESGAIAYGPSAVSVHQAWAAEAGNGVAGFRSAPRPVVETASGYRFADDSRIVTQREA